MTEKELNVNGIKISNTAPFVLIAGPCVIESEKLVHHVAAELKKITQLLGVPFIFKASYDKANRTSVDAFRGPGIKEGLRILADIKNDFNVPILTDVHLPQDVEQAAKVADILQVPAFLIRQTDLIMEFAKSGRVVNVKKAQFVSPEEMQFVIEKIEYFNNKNILLTERGTFFGYNNLVVDMRSFDIMKGFGYPVIFDATHSVQNPGAGGGKTSGKREFIPTLSRSATAAGIAGLFMEVHPDPDKGLSDAANMFPLGELESFLKTIIRIDGAVKNEK